MFMTGQEEIESTVKCIRDISKDMLGEAPPLVVCPLYAALPSHLQLRVFHKTPQVRFVKDTLHSFQSTGTVKSVFL